MTPRETKFRALGEPILEDEVPVGQRVQRATTELYQIVVTEDRHVLFVIQTRDIHLDGDVHDWRANLDVRWELSTQVTPAKAE